MTRRRFDHLFLEVSLAIEAPAPRYALWLGLHDLGWDPDALTREQAAAFCDGPLRRLLAERGIALAPRAERRLRRAVARFDPRVTTPEEHFARL